MKNKAINAFKNTESGLRFLFKSFPPFYQRVQQQSDCRDNHKQSNQGKNLVYRGTSLSFKGHRIRIVDRFAAAHIYMIASRKFSRDNQPVGINSVGRAGHKCAELLPLGDSDFRNIVRFDGFDFSNAVIKNRVQHLDLKSIACFKSVDIIEQL